MGRTIITHVGTSLLDCKAAKPRRGSCLTTTDQLRDLENNLQDELPVSDKDLHCFEAHFQEGLKRYWGDELAGDPKVVAQGRRTASPSEIASLSLLKPTRGDRVVLLHTDTAQGKFCGERLCEALKLDLGNEFPQCDSVCVEVKGLKVIEGATETTSGQFDTFVGEGLKNYVNTAWSEFDKLLREGSDPRKLIFNVTGGYKGTIPFARDLVLILADVRREQEPRVACSLCYLFERSDRLIWYGAFPIIFDWDGLPVCKLRDGQKLEGAPYDSLELYPHYFVEHHANSSRVSTSALGSLILALHDVIYLHQ